MSCNVMTEHYEEITVCGKPALFTNFRIKRDTVPDSLYVYAGEDLPEDAAQQSDAESQKQTKPQSTSQKQEQPPMPCICVRCNQPINRVKLKDGSIMQAAEFANTHEGMCVDCYKATRLNVA